MKITKYEHSCVVIEDAGKQVVIDPGAYADSYVPSDKIEAVVVTHIHGDHFNIDKLLSIAKLNPNASFYGPAQVAAEAGQVNMETAEAGQSHKTETFSLDFFGGSHELYEGFENLGLMVNQLFFHPGDSYTAPDKPVRILGLPAAAPWLRVPDTIEYLKRVKPEIAIPIHNAVLSNIGESIHYRLMSEAAASINTKWTVLRPGESLEL
jgi:L-ascorbate metabolism protein UlaG (beta-lactamase superfamily)